MAKFGKRLQKKDGSSEAKAAAASGGNFAIASNPDPDGASGPKPAAAAAVWKEAKLNPVRSVGLKLFLLIFFSILACVLTVGMLAYNESRSMVERKVSEATQQTVNQVADNLDIFYQTFEDLSLQIMVDKDIHALIGEMTASGEDFARFEATRALSDKLAMITLSNSVVKGISLIPLTEGLNPLTAGSAQSPKAAALKETEWFKRTVELDGRTHWVAPQPEGLTVSTSTPVIGLSRVLKDSVSSQANYVMLLEFQSSSLTERYEDVSLGEGSELYIIDAAGNYVVAADPALIGQPAAVTIPDGDKDGSLKLTDKEGTDVLTVYNTFDRVDWRLVGTIPVESLVKDADAIRELTVLTAAVAAVLAIAIGAVVIVTVGRPLVRLSALMGEGAQGNLTVRSTIRKRRDEIGQLSSSFNGMMAQITELAQRTTRSAEDVLLTAGELSDASRRTAQSAKEIAAATEEIAKGATSLAVEAERGADLTGTIGGSMEKGTSANDEMGRSAAEVEHASVQGTEHMASLIEKTGLTEEMTRSMMNRVDKLKDSTRSIVKILDVLNNITKQTNILSLNATIEASRAGAAGKGFMVVADEIRKLAFDTRQSIDVVAQITQSIAQEVDETVQTLTDAYPLFREQIDSVKEANGLFLGVQSQMAQFVQKLEVATSAVDELGESQALLAEAMTNVSSVAEEASATSEEVASLSSEQLSVSEGLVQLSGKLDAVSRELKEALTQFKL